MPVSHARPRPRAATAPAAARLPAAESFGLTAGIARGDEAAFAAFYELWFERAVGMVRAMTRRDEAFCLDVVQDCMLKVARRMRPLRSEAAVTQWMGRTLATTAIDALRAETRRSRREAMAARTDEAGDDHPRDLEQAEMCEWLVARLADLPERERALLIRRFEGDETLAEIGSAFGMSGNAVHGRIRRAVDRLRERAREWLR